MFELIALIIFIISFGGVVFLLVRKAPVLSTLPKNGTSGIKKHKIIFEAENKFKRFSTLFSDRIILHKFLSWFRCQIIKVETLVDETLSKMRKKAKEDKLSGKK